MKSIEILIIFITLVFIIPPLINYSNKISFKFEPFANISPGTWPESDTVGLLSLDNKNKKDFYEWNNSSSKMSGLNYARQSLSYPMYSAKSNIINNLEFWPLPINGTCAYPELCGNFYKPLDCKKQKEDNNPIYIQPECNHGERVGFYCSKK